MTTKILTQARLKKLVHYDPETGLFTNLVHRAGNALVGKTPGWKHSCGYVAMAIDYKDYLAHRLAFLYMNGSMPLHVDHINQIKNDNRWSNLRAADFNLNSKNMPMSSKNTSGITGVVWDKSKQSWKAQIGVKKKVIFLGNFDNIEDAAAARLIASNNYGFSPIHGL